ncbi:MULTISPECIES: hypothetical protein [Actinomycetes]|uniref:hypothetical protein n=1 Tax=Actinomycetes TaxID=1760 RepID=UPI0033DAFA4E
MMDIVSSVLVALVLLGALLGAIDRWPYRARRNTAARLETVPHCACGAPIPSGCRWCVACYSRPAPAERAVAPAISPTITTMPGGTL